MKASPKSMSSAKATTRHAIRAIMGDVNSETQMVGLVNCVIGSDVEHFYSPIVCSCSLTYQRRCYFIPKLVPILSTKAMSICTNNQSLLKAIQSGSADTTHLKRMHNKRAGKTTLLRIPGDHGNADNEEADACAKQAAAITEQSPSPQPRHSSAEL